MKRFLLPIFACIFCSYFFISCDKDGNELEEEKILNERIEDIIPKVYLDSLQKLGFPVNMGTKPPKMDGAYYISPYILDTSNIANDYPGKRFTSGKLNLSGQNNTDYSINLTGEYFIADKDTSIVTAISGNGNKFTVYGKVKASRPDPKYYAFFGLLFSGELTAEGIKDVKVGIINIDNSKTDGWFILEGMARIAYDEDGMSVKLDSNDEKALINNTENKILKLLGQKPKPDNAL